MPAYLSHAIFSNSIFPYLEKYHLLKLEISTSKLRLDAIKPDFFARPSNIYSCNDENHNYHVQKFVKTQMEYIISQKLWENPNVMSQFYGHVLHCIMDQKFHPFVYGRTDNAKTNSLPVNGRHFELESLIDSYLVKKHYPEMDMKDYATFCVNPKYIFLDKEEKTTINECYKRVYGYSKVSTTSILLSIGLMLEERIIRCDYTALKRKLYEKLNFNYLSRNIKDDEYISAMNLEHNTWMNLNNPNSLKYNESIDDLFIDTINYSLEVLEVLNHSIYDKKRVDDKIFTIFPDISLDTGIKCNYQKKI